MSKVYRGYGPEKLTAQRKKKRLPLHLVESIYKDHVYELLEEESMRYKIPLKDFRVVEEETL